MLKTVPELVKEIRQTTQTISAIKAYLLAKKEESLFIDVREPLEVDNSPVAGSINLPRGILEMNIAKISSDEDSLIFLHCATGGRATFAAEQLTRLGYKHVWAITCPHNDVCKAQQQS